MRFWVDIEDVAGQRLGAGPIRTATNWEYTPRLDQVGEWAFTMPAGDAQQALVRIGRIARAWGMVDGQLLELGGGPIEERSIAVSAQGTPLLAVRGDDRLRELACRTVGDLALLAVVCRHPTYTEVHDPYAGTHTALTWATNLDVGDGSTYDWFKLGVTSDMTTLKAWYIYSATPFRGVRLVFGPRRNTVALTLTLEYWNGGAWNNLSCTDGTGALAYDGDLLWDTPTDWAPGPEADSGQYELRILSATVTDDMDLADLAVIRDEPTDDALGQIMAVVSGEWSLDAAQGYTATERARALGADLLTNAGLETITGTPDDGASDALTGWTSAGVSDGIGNRVEATATCHGGTLALKISRASASTLPELYQDVTVSEATDYLLTGWARGDGTARPRVQVEDRSHSASNQCLTPRESLPASTSWAAFAVPFTTPVGCTSVRVHLLASASNQAFGAVYYDDLTVQARQGGAVFLQMAGESVLETLGRVATATGEHFILSPGGTRRVLWLGRDQRASGLRAIAARAGVSSDDDIETALIAQLEETQSRYELATRVYPRGPVSLGQCTRAVPSGFTLDKANSCLIWDTAETALGRIDKPLDIADVAVRGDSAEQTQFASNAVFDQCYQWLLDHSATDTHPITGDIPRSYRVTLAKCNRWLSPGYRIRVTYARRLNGYLAVSIDADLWILAATLRIDEQGLRTVGLEVATVAAHPLRNDADRLVQEIRSLRAAVVR